MKKLDDFAQKGSRLLEGREPVETHSSYGRWVNEVTGWLNEIAPGTGLSAEWVSLGTSELVTSRGYAIGTIAWHNFNNTVQRRLLWLSKLPERLSSFISQNKTVEKSQAKHLDNSKVFVVHGHNDKVKEMAARFIEKLGLKATILHEQPNSGRTIIEKFINYADVGYAVVILTADDLAKPHSDRSSVLQPRARQNVIFELGYFIGKLGRERVCALYEEGVEIPSDYQGVLFTKIDDEGMWKFKLAREMKAVGLTIDLNAIS